MTRRAKIVLIITGALTLVVAVNWFAVTVHIDNLRTTAGRSSGDAVPELLAQADEFRGAQIVFAVLAMVLTATFVMVVARAVRRSRRGSDST